MTFTIPFYKYKLPDWEIKQTKLLDIYNSVNFYKDYQTNVYTDYGANQEYKEKILDIVETDIQTFVKEAKLNSCFVSDLWLQKYENNQFHAVHNHGAIGYSSVLYLKFHKFIHKATHFISPYTNAKGLTETFVPEVEEGDIIFFPSVINHFTEPVNTTFNRVILSMNIKERSI